MEEDDEIPLGQLKENKGYGMFMKHATSAENKAMLARSVIAPAVNKAVIFSRNTFDQLLEDPENLLRDYDRPVRFTMPASGSGHTEASQSSAIY